ncbi:type II toxin-antitoxin system Phd/YefM family antitoxin [Methylobacterium sp. J-048]|uniref:type II toxin-antitoxin system Phd/YefM family antitoxin n=1 Tax=Methylobacterium sp. J-048 TaxID=2836635 RepID=UPI001FB8F215|nr:type II toxin-antitoxin system Phd/YefM family antitoxin [Methylobacterium sp. J-048]MCJ2059952.1 type II toxin-antitoxin system Phd/YefM family antitoxin [Methylobacterium sp. J-048]
MRSWQAADAKQNFGRLVDAAREGPQMLLRHAEPVGVVLSMEHYERLKAQADAEFANFLLASPLDETDFDRDVGMSLSGG